jgi:hypothetical protein
MDVVDPPTPPPPRPDPTRCPPPKPRLRPHQLKDRVLLTISPVLILVRLCFTIPHRPPHHTPHLNSPSRPVMFPGRQWGSVQLTTCSRRTVVPFHQNYNITTTPPMCVCSSSRTVFFHPHSPWGCWSRHMMTHTKKPVDHVFVPSPRNR